MYIFGGGGDFQNFINGLNLDPAIPLSIVAHSHGGNVVKLASYGINRPINYLVNLGTPQNWDLPDINPFILYNYCQVSSFEDYVQFFGAGLYQIDSWSYDQYSTSIWLEQEAIDLYYNFWDDAAYDAAQVAFYEADASFWWFSAKLAYYATNVMLGSESHSDLHTVPVWNNSIKTGCGLPQ